MSLEISFEFKQALHDVCKNIKLNKRLNNILNDIKLKKIFEMRNVIVNKAIIIINIFIMLFYLSNKLYLKVYQS